MQKKAEGKVAPVDAGPPDWVGGPVAAAMQCRCALCYPFRCQILSCHCFGGCVVLLFCPAPAAACNSRSQHETTILFDRQSRRNKQYTFCASAAQHRLYLLLCTQLLLCRFHVPFALFHFHHTQTLSVFSLARFAARSPLGYLLRFAGWLSSIYLILGSLQCGRCDNPVFVMAPRAFPGF